MLPDLITAIRDLLIAKNPRDAMYMLQSAPEDVLLQSDLSKLWTICREANFTPGEILLAPLIERKYEGQPADYIHAVDSYVRAGMTDVAATAFAALLSFLGAARQIRVMIGLAARLGRADICQAVLQCLIADTDISVRDKVINGVQFAAAVEAVGMRYLSIRSMSLCMEIAGSEIESLQRIAGTLEGLREFSMALEVRTRAAKADPDDVLKALEVAKLLAVTDKVKAVEALAALLKRPADTATFWTGISMVQQRLGKTLEAIARMEQALKCGGDANTVQRRLADLCMTMNDTRGALNHIKRMAKRPELQPGDLRHLSNMALKSLDHALALFLAKRQYEESGHAFDALLFLAETLSVMGQTSAAGSLMAGFCEGLPSLKPLARAEMLKAADVAAKIARDDLRLRIIDIALTWFPGDVGLSDIKKQVSKRLNFLGTGR